MNSHFLKAGILLAHGSRDPLWMEPLKKILEKVRLNNPTVLWELAFLESCAPNLEESFKALVAKNSSIFSVKIIPVFMAAGTHLRQDLPRLVKPLKELYPHLKIEIGSVLGEEEKIQEALAHFISHSLT